MSEPRWRMVGALPEEVSPAAVRVSPAGYGVVATTTEPGEGSPREQMRARRMLLWLATAEELRPVYDGAGWLQTMDVQADTWFAVAATPRSIGAGADYRLLRSTDGGRTWEVPGSIPVQSLSQVLAVSENEAWVLGTDQLAITLDGGASWNPVQPTSERDPTRERLCRSHRDVVLVGPGLSTFRDGGSSFSHRAMPGPVYDVAEQMLIAQVEGVPRLGAFVGEELRWLGRLGKDRVPLRLAVAGDVVRILSRAVDPAGGNPLALHRSQDGGRTFAEVELGLTQRTDIAGLGGLGVDLRGRVFRAPHGG